jgi:uncharacterized membrane protein YkvA (DUF1232 family)
MLETIRTLIFAGCLVVVVFIVAVSLPQSKLRDFLMPIVGWCFALFCGAYVLMPIDAVPDYLPVAGWVDDIGTAVAGIASARAAMRSGKPSRN